MENGFIGKQFHCYPKSNSSFLLIHRRVKVQYQCIGIVKNTIKKNHQLQIGDVVYMYHQIKLDQKKRRVILLL